jgi:hypothetical protein
MGRRFNRREVLVGVHVRGTCGHPPVWGLTMRGLVIAIVSLSSLLGWQVAQGPAVPKVAQEVDRAYGWMLDPARAGVGN